jgi:hypothetical protein
VVSALGLSSAEQYYLLYFRYSLIYPCTYRVCSPHPSHHLHSLATPHSTLQHYAHRLSGGAFLGFYHMGVVRALWTEGLLPRVISGASAGSIMTAIIG